MTTSAFQDNPIIERTEPLLLAGMAAPLPPKAAPVAERPRVIQELVRAFQARASEIPHRLGKSRYSVIDHDVFESKETPIINAMVAVSSLVDLPPWCKTLVVPPGRFAVFLHQGPPKDIGKTVARIYAEWLPRIPELFRINRELFIYPADYDPAHPGSTFEYCLPL